MNTCGQCHPGVTEKFALSKVHVDAPLSADIGSVAVRWIRKLYLGMIFAVIGAMLLHNLDHLAAQGVCCAASMSIAMVVAHDAPSALAARHAVHQFHHARDHRICAEVPRFLVRRRCSG